MDGGCKLMDDFCIWVERILSWVDRTGTPPIPWIGQAGGRLRNPPAPHLEFVYAMEGTWKGVEIGSLKTCFLEGHVSLHNVHVGNRSLPMETDGRAWCCFFDVAGVPEFAAVAREPLFCNVPVGDGPRLVVAFEELQKRCRVLVGPPGSYLAGAYAYDAGRAARLSVAERFAVKSACIDLLAALLREGERSRGEGPGLPDAVRRAVEFISVHSREPDLRLDRIAQAAGLSMDHFGRLFRAALRVTPMHYLQAVRVEHSRFLLRHTQLRVEEVARESGFADPYYFSRVFTRQTGLSPRAWRQKKEN